MLSMQDLVNDVKVSSPAPRHTIAFGKMNLGAGARAGAGAPGRVTWRPSAASGGVAA